MILPKDHTDKATEKVLILLTIFTIAMIIYMILNL
jgi:hypothetical protein